MDASALRTLTRAQIQKLARREQIKANAKTDLIIRQLCAKYPDGVLSLQEAAKTRRTSARVEKMRAVKVEEEVPSAGVSGDKRPSKRQRVAEAEELVVQEMEGEPPAQEVRGQPEAGTAANIPQLVVPVIGPLAESAWTTLQDLSGTVDGSLETNHRLQEMRVLVRAVGQRVTKVQVQLGELQNKRKVVERRFLSRLKRDQRLWDGSHSWVDGEPERPVQPPEIKRAVFKIRIPARIPAQSEK